MFEKALLLDTCALLWLVSGDKKISDATRMSINQASIVFVSAISAWEISLKVAQGHLELPMDSLPWFQQAITSHNLTLAPLDLDIIVSANQLPWHHKDPADRFIISTALREKATIVTADTKFANYVVATII